jgi:hypothetical protein
MKQFCAIVLAIQGGAYAQEPSSGLDLRAQFQALRPTYGNCAERRGTPV